MQNQSTPSALIPGYVRMGPRRSIRLYYVLVRAYVK